MPPVGGWTVTGVYKLENLVNGKVYIGSAALHFLVRIRYHRSRLEKGTHENVYLQRAWNKYGSSKFRFSIVERCAPSKCLEREQYWMDLLKSYERDKGYNICPTAGSRKGSKWSETTRKKMEVVHKDPEHRAKVSLARRGRKLSEDELRRRTLKQTGLKRSSETKAKISASHSTPEAREAKSTTSFKMWATMSPEVKAARSAKISAALKGKKRAKGPTKQEDQTKNTGDQDSGVERTGK